MITAVDSSVLLDIFSADAAFGPRSRVALESCGDAGRLICCEVVWAEVSAGFPDHATVDAAMARVGVEFEAMDEWCASAAGSAWRAYRSRGGSRTTMIADFLIGAHALTRADRLLTRDRGFLSNFAGLTILDPTSTQ